MTTIHRRGRLAVAGILAAAALGSATPDQRWARYYANCLAP
jgi:hypothetical protein